MAIRTGSDALMLPIFDPARVCSWRVNPIRRRLPVRTAATQGAQGARRRRVSTGSQ